MERLPIFGTGVKSVSPFITAQRRLNAYYDVRQDNDQTQLCIRGTPGLTKLIDLPTSPIRGWVEAGDYLYVVAGVVVYQVCRTGGYITIGSIDESSTPYTPVSMAINQSQIMIVDGVQGYVFNYDVIGTVPSATTAAINLIISQCAVLHSITEQTGNE